ncbi:hypothetical protein Rrhod_0695 [Rhodococcus rhodnii LMG 5362]|uniref:ABC transmembrane type-1 domain-containing protein n=1 Tax=Rhodococcus rhodnii LMG 5362 TaxID=1273125 RepID=R7WRT6_9NOCA|nr:ABC transporter permease subunit [Rhodococcus rhodnii]EOM78021.1 hypothetical protein Rrhod_0695 [Rhodococcus rhodnii LMG 5362]
MSTPVRPGSPVVTSPLLAAAGLGLLFVLFEGIGQTEVFGRNWPPLSEVVSFVASNPPVQATLQRALVATGTSAAQGLLLGAVVGIGAAALGVLVRSAATGLDRLAAVVHAVPLIAIAPLLVTTVGRAAAPTVTAAIGAGFAIFVAATAALASAPAALGDVHTVLGSSRWSRLRMLQLPHGLPLMLDGAAVAASAAVIGAILGEWFGAPRGLGVVLVSAMNNYQIPLLWSAAIGCVVLSLTAYGVLRGVAALVRRRTA